MGCMQLMAFSILNYREIWSNILPTQPQYCQSFSCWFPKGGPVDSFGRSCRTRNYACLLWLFLVGNPFTSQRRVPSIRRNNRQKSSTIFLPLSQKLFTSNKKIIRYALSILEGQVVRCLLLKVTGSDDCKAATPQQISKLRLFRVQIRFARVLEFKLLRVMQGNQAWKTVNILINSRDISPNV